MNGEILSPGDAKVSIFDQAFLYGMSCFETVRVFEGIPFLLNEHLSRLHHAVTSMGFPPPAGLDNLEDIAQGTLEGSGLLDAVLRITVTPGIGGPLNMLDGEWKPMLIVSVLPLPLLNQDWYHAGVCGYVSRWRKGEGTIPQGAKVGNYAGNLLAGKEAKEYGADMAIMLDKDAEVAGGNFANIFMRVDDIWQTPAPSSATLPGIIRGWVIRLLERNGEEYLERSWHPGEFARASEAFFSSSIRGLVPLVQVNEVRIGNGTPGKETRALMDRYRTDTGSRTQMRS